MTFQLTPAITKKQEREMKRQLKAQMEDQALRRRINGIYRGQETRRNNYMAKYAAEHCGQYPDPERMKIDYSAEELFALVKSVIGALCPYCGERKLTIDNFVLDHVEAIDCGGSFKAENQIPCCSPCNNAKGSVMNAEQYRALLAFLKTQPHEVKMDILRRLRAGGRAGAARGGFGRKNGGGDGGS